MSSHEVLTGIGLYVICVLPVFVYAMFFGINSK